MSADPQAYITNHLSTKSLPVSESWLSQLLSSHQPGIAPLPTLAKTALFRLLTSDFTSSLSITSTNSHQLLPLDVSNPSVKERHIVGPVPVQVLDIEDIGTSTWSQVEAIERIERGETLRGRQVIRNVTRQLDGDENTGDTARGAVNPGSNQPESAKSAGPYRLVLQDASGAKLLGFELTPVQGINFNDLAIGAKLLIKNATVARGIMLLEPACVTVLGGKIESLHQEWTLGRKARLLTALDSSVNTD
ncbi:hypothetical protein FQN57_004459 [Myotisia sp. PD_48]|nr:hypothetical protein FQN57_004459 [Myotisia sp. PD_48]